MRGATWGWKRRRTWRFSKSTFSRKRTEVSEEQALAAGLSGELTAFGHRLLARVYYADTDFSGIVYHARYLEFLERGRSDYLRLAGVRHTELLDGQRGEKIVWVVRHMQIDFLKPARMDDVLTVDTSTERISGARIFM